MHPEYVAAVKHSGLLKKHIRKREAISIQHSETELFIDKVLEGLKQLLSKPEWKNCDIYIVLSGHFSKFRVSKWNESLSKDERQVLLRHQVEEIYAEKFQVFIAESGFGKNGLAVAIEHNFYLGLLDLEKKLNIKFLSINPYFVAITNHWRGSIDASALLIIREDAFVYTASIKNNSWEIIKTILASDGWEQEVERALGLEVMPSDLNSGKINCYFHEENKSNLNLKLLTGASNPVILLSYNGMPEANPKFYFARYVA